MDEAFELLFLIFAAGAIWLAVVAARQRRMRRQYGEDFAKTSERLDRIEFALRRLQERPAAPTSAEVTAAGAPSVVVPKAEPVTIVTAPPPVKRPEPVPTAVPRKPVTAPQVPLGTGITPLQPNAAPPPPVIPPRAVSPPPPTTDKRLRKALALEEKLGANWLNKVGVILLVLGVAFLLIYQFGGTPIGKVLLSYLGAALGLSGGVWLEHRQRYTVFARSCIGGGWALAYFTTYAMYHVSAARVLQSQRADLVLLLIIAAMMVAHTLYYRSQTACALAFLLGFLTVTLSHSTVYSLSAGAVLALALVAIVTKMRWYELEVLGMIASYINHFYWLYPIIESHPRSFAEYLPSAGLLIFYWAAFRLSYVVRRIANTREESLSTFSALLNTCLLVALMKYQSQRPELAFWFLLALGAVDFTLGQLPNLRRRRPAFLVLSTIGASLLIAAFALRYSGGGLAVIWLIEAQVLFAAGGFLREIHFRRLGLLAAAAASGYLLATGTGYRSDLRHGGLFALAALLFYLDAHGAPRWWPHLDEKGSERLALRVISCAGGVMAFIAIWVAIPDMWIAVGWAVLALGLVLLGRKLISLDFVVQAVFFAIAALIRVSLVNVELASTWHQVTFRAITLATVAALFYLCALWSRVRDLAITAQLRALYTSAAAFLIALLIWNEVPAMWAAVAWMGLAVVLAICGRYLKLPELAFQGNLLALIAVVRVVSLNLYATELYQHNLIRLETVGAVVVLLYIISNWASVPKLEGTRNFGHLHTWVASILLALLAWYELRPISVAPAWTVLALVLFELGLGRHSANLRAQGYTGLAAACVRVFLVNLNAGAPGALSPRVYTIVPLAVALYYVYARLETARELSAAERQAHVPQWQAWFGTLTVAAVLRFEVPAYWVCAAWAASALALLTISWATKRRVFEHHAMILGAAVLVRAVLFNLPERTSFMTRNGNLFTLGVAAALLLLTLPIAFRIRTAFASKETRSGFLGQLERHPEQVFFFLPVALITALLAIEMSKGVMTLAWGLEGMVVFLVALLVKERSFRLTGLVLLLVCVLKIVSVDVWAQEPRDRYLTLIVLGGALLLVSFLYNRYRETLRQFL